MKTRSVWRSSNIGMQVTSGKNCNWELLNYHSLSLTLISSFLLHTGSTIPSLPFSAAPIDDGIWLLHSFNQVQRLAVPKSQFQIPGRKSDWLCFRQTSILGPVSFRWRELQSNHGCHGIRRQCPLLVGCRTLLFLLIWFDYIFGILIVTWRCLRISF